MLLKCHSVYYICYTCTYTHVSYSKWYGFTKLYNNHCSTRLWSDSNLRLVLFVSQYLIYVHVLHISKVVSYIGKMFNSGTCSYPDQCGQKTE